MKEKKTHNRVAIEVVKPSENKYKQKDSCGVAGGEQDAMKEF
jgi:Ca2+-binding EF-hand superfamily protein